MRNIAIAAACVMVTGTALADNWSEFRDPNGAFSVTFPSSPVTSNAQTDVGNGAKVPMSVYNANYGGGQFTIVDTNLSGYKVDPIAAVENAAKGIKSAAAETKGEAVAHVDGQNGRALWIVDKNGNRVLDRIFFVGGHLYQVMATSPANSPEDDSQRFVNSFHIATP